jgi:TIR domain-containing protein
MKVFISYSSRTDMFEGRFVHHFLEDDGIEVFRDERTFTQGRLPEEIRNGIAGADAVVAVLTARYYESEFTSDELGQARSLNKPILFITTDRSRPKGLDSDRLPLDLLGAAPARWRALITGAVRRLAPAVDRTSPVVMARALSEAIDYNDLVRAAVEQQPVLGRHLTVGSTVELATMVGGWTRSECRIEADAVDEPEAEVAAVLGPDSHVERDNLRLLSFAEDLSDEPGLALGLAPVAFLRVKDVAARLEEIQRIPLPRRLLFERSKTAYPHSVVVHLTLITQDDYLVLGHRSDRPRFYEKTWSATYEEHMRPSMDGADPFATAMRGLEEELVGGFPFDPGEVDIRFFSLFREYDRWLNREKGSFLNINVGLAGRVRVPCSAETLFKHWRLATDQNEFEYLVAIPYTFDNVWPLLRDSHFDPRSIPDVRSSVGPGADFPALSMRPDWRRQHPTNTVRLIRCLQYDFPDRLDSEVAALL